MSISDECELEGLGRRQLALQDSKQTNKPKKVLHGKEDYIGSLKYYTLSPVKQPRSDNLVNIFKKWHAPIAFLRFEAVFVKTGPKQISAWGVS
ncbi:hypothetical protein GCM10027189_11530 [Rufibacter soli]